MALSGSFGNTFRTGYRLQVDWSGSQSISGNYTTITANLYLISLGSSYTISSSATKDGSQTIDGVSNTFTTAGAGLSGNQKKLLNTYTRTVYHNADGTKSLYMSAWYDIEVTLGGTYYGRVSCSSDIIYLDTIPRASSVSSDVSWTAGTQDLAVSISRASSSFTHTVALYVQRPSDNSWQWVAQRDNVGTSVTFDFSLQENTNIYTNIGQYENRPAKVLCITYNGGSEIGRSEKVGTVYGAGIAKISFSNFNIGASIPATISGMQDYEGFQYTGIFKIAGTTIKTFTFSPSTPNPTLTFTQAEIDQMYSLTPNSNSVSGQVTVTSKYNGVDINDGLPAPTYDPNFNFTAYVTNANPIFTAGSISYADVDQTTVGITGNNQFIIQNKSSLTAYVNTAATAQKSATLVKYVVTINGKQGEITTATGNVNIGTITAGTNQTLTITAIDSRGNQTPLTLDVNVLPYTDPTLSISLERLNKFENHTTLKVSGTFSILSVGGVTKNAIVTLQYRYKEKTATDFGGWTALTFSTNGGTFMALDVILQLENTKAWDFEVQVDDKLVSNTDPASVGTGQPILFIDTVKKSVGVNKFPELNGSFELEGQLSVSGAGSFGAGITVNGDTTITGNLIFDGATKGIKFDADRTNKSEIFWNANANSDYGLVVKVDGKDSAWFWSSGDLTINGKLNVGLGGISFPTDPYGGSGDWVGLYVQKYTNGSDPESMELVIDAQNDWQDRVRITSRLHVNDQISTDWGLDAQSIELTSEWAYIDFKSSSSVDYDMRIGRMGNDWTLGVQGADLVVYHGQVFCPNIILGSGSSTGAYGVNGAIWYGNGYAGTGFYSYQNGWTKRW